MKLNLNRNTGILAMLTATLSSALAAPGSLDTKFNTTGMATANYGGTEAANAVAVGVDGKIVIAGTTNTLGNSDISVIRYNSNGTLDTTFSNDGGVITEIGTTSEDVATAVAVQKDGKILVAGFTNVKGENDVLLLRYNKEGSLDTFFGQNGKVVINNFNNDQPAAIAIQPDGKIIVAGTEGVGTGVNCDFSVRRFLPNGANDTTFGNDGTRFINVGGVDIGTSIALQADGKVILAGYTNGGGTNDFAVVRLTNEGNVDNSFDTDGKASFNFGADDRAAGAAIQKDGKIVLAGYYDMGASDFAVLRCNVNGSLDTSFTGDGMESYSFGAAEYGRSVAIQTDGKIVVSGFANLFGTNDYALLRVKPNGDVDLAFDMDGRVTTPIAFDSVDAGYALALQADGRAVVAGVSDSDFAIARYNMSVKTDVLIGKTASATTGNNIYNTTGASQTLPLSIAKKGGKATSFVRIQNDGHDTGTFKIKGTAGNASFDVKYLNGTTNVTAAVKAGTFNTGNVAAGSAFLLKVEITAKTTKAKQNRSFFITGTSAVDSSSADTVLITASSK